jgi:prolyl-tRNA editing enzyme YbaK/EbsC (Cys-tRNA(Pro) deacylase)
LRTVALLLAFPTSCAAACAPLPMNTPDPEEPPHTEPPEPQEGTGATPPPPSPPRLSWQRVLEALVASKQWAAMRQLLRAAPFGPDTVVPTRQFAVRALLRAGHAPQAEALIADFPALRETFPAVADGSRRATLRRLLGQGQIALAADLCGQDEGLRRWLLCELASRGGHGGGGGGSMLAAARTLAVERWGVGPQVMAALEDAGSSSRRRQEWRPDDGGPLAAAGIVGRGTPEDPEEDPGPFAPSRSGRSQADGVLAHPGHGAQGRRWLQLPLVDSSVVVVHDLAGLSRARSLLLPPGVAAAPPGGETVAAAEVTSRPWVLGLDAEWKPTARRAGPSMQSGGSGAVTMAKPGPRPVSIVQIASRTHCVLLDLLALLRPGSSATSVAAGGGAAAALTPEEEAVDALLSEVFRGAAVLPIGFCWGGDMRKLRSSYPQLPCLARAARVLDVRHLAQLVRPELLSLGGGGGGGGGSHGGGGRIGLGALVESVLGQPLDKRCQCSDWERRPLSEAQRRYAALDAWCLTAVVDTLVSEMTLDEAGEAAAAAAAVCPRWERVRDLVEDVPDMLSAEELSGTARSEQQQRSRGGRLNDMDNGAAVGKAPVVGRDGVAALTPQDVQAHIDAARLAALGDPAALATLEGVALRITSHSAARASDAAAALQVEEGLVGKSLAFWCAPRAPLTVVLRGNDMVDRGRLARALGVATKKGRRGLVIASRHECVEVWGYPPGSMPPFAHRSHQRSPATDASSLSLSTGLLPIRTIIDQALVADLQATLALGGGGPRTLCELPAAALLRLCGAAAEVHAVAKDAGPGARAEGAAVGLSRLPLDTVCAGAAGGLDHSELGEVGERRFVVGNEMFRLARWLRVIGVDAAGMPPPHEASQAEISAALAAGRAQGRILLTRNKSMAARQDSGATYFVRASKTEAQFKEVQTQFGLVFSDDTFMSRCAVCNGAGFNGPIGPEAVVGCAQAATIPPGVRTQPRAPYDDDHRVENPRPPQPVLGAPLVILIRAPVHRPAMGALCDELSGSLPDFGRQIGIVAACWLPVLDLRRRLAASQKSDLCRPGAINQSPE